MSGESTGQVLSASSTSAAVALLPATGGDVFLHVINVVAIALGVIVFVSLTASRIYRSTSK